MILKTYVSLALHSKRYETRLTQTVEVCNVLLFCEVHCFEKRPYDGTALEMTRTETKETTGSSERFLDAGVQRVIVLDFDICNDGVTRE